MGLVEETSRKALALEGDARWTVPMLFPRNGLACDRYKCEYTPICRALHGKIFTDATLNGFPPPNHYSCRSMLLPVTRLDHGWQEQMLQQGRIDVKPQEGFATPTVTEQIAATGRLS